MRKKWIFMPMVHWYLSVEIFFASRSLSLAFDLCFAAFQLYAQTHSLSFTRKFLSPFSDEHEPNFFSAATVVVVAAVVVDRWMELTPEQVKKTTTTTNNHYTNLLLQFKYSFSRSNSDRKSALFSSFLAKRSLFYFCFFLLLLNQTSNCNAELKTIYNFTSKIYNEWKLCCWI